MIKGDWVRSRTNGTIGRIDDPAVEQLGFDALHNVRIQTSEHKFYRFDTDDLEPVNVGLKARVWHARTPYIAGMEAFVSDGPIVARFEPDATERWDGYGMIYGNDEGEVNGVLAELKAEERAKRKAEYDAGLTKRAEELLVRSRTWTLEDVRQYLAAEDAAWDEEYGRTDDD